nr:MAG TPA: hypothetical protein [Caudoviricetes sp.]
MSFLIFHFSLYIHFFVCTPRSVLMFYISLTFQAVLPTNT